MDFSEEDVRKMIRLVGELASVPGSHSDKKNFLMWGLCELISADAWVWALSCQSDPDKPQVYVSFLRGGFSDEGYTKLLMAVEHPEMVTIAHRFFKEVRESMVHITKARHQIIEDSIFEKTEAFSAWKEADVGSLILSQRPLDVESGSSVGLYRRLDREPFSEREVQIANIILTEVPWLHLQGWPQDRGATVPHLSKRQRLTLNLLTQGLTQKEIASAMNLSLHTVRGYIKMVYKHFGVDSQKELMNNFMGQRQRDAGPNENGDSSIIAS